MTLRTIADDRTAKGYRKLKVHLWAGAGPEIPLQAQDQK